MLGCVANVRLQRSIVYTTQEAVPLALEPDWGKSVYLQHGQRVVMGQRLMQPASDLSLAGARPTPRISSSTRGSFGTPRSSPSLKHSIGRCSWATPRPVDGVRTGPRQGWRLRQDQRLSRIERKFDEAVGDFSVAYADQAERDHATLKEAVRQGKVTAYLEARSR